MKKIILSFCFCINVVMAFSQNAGVGMGSPHASAALDVAANNKGLLPPRVALTSINDVATIAAPAAGLLVYNTATAGVSPSNVVPGYYYYTGSNWLMLGQQANGAGDLQYWSGTQWVLVPAGASGKILTMCDGVPTWGPCVVPVLPTVTTVDISSIAGTSANGAGNVTSDGNGIISARGICYDLNPSPDITRYVALDDSTGPGSFVTSLLNLSPATFYYARAFATNRAGTAYGAQTTFTTGTLSLPVVNALQIFGIGSNSAVATATLVSDGGNPQVTRGFAYGTSPNPTIGDQIAIVSGNGPGSFTASLTGLQPNTTYYVRAFASGPTNPPNNYSSEVSFTTPDFFNFAVAYLFDSVTLASGIVDPTPLPDNPGNGITVSAFSATGAGVPSFNPTAAGRFSFSDWTLGATNGSNTFTSAIDSTGKYYEVTVTPDQFVSLDLSSISFRLQRSGTGVRQVFVRSSVDGFAANLPATVTPANANLSVVATNKFQITDITTTAQDGCTITLGGPAFTGLLSPVTFRFYGVNAEAPGGIFSIDNVIISGRAL
jgi:hypothetical protein